jgi:2,3-bisphosphoglycerate-independent phosphoglycerate mutase
VVAAITRDEHDFILANFANPDMVGHTGVWAATVTALEVIDECLGRILDAASARDNRDPAGPGSVVLVTADHGNADEMRNAAGEAVTAHSLNPVPIVITGRAVAGRSLHDGILADVAPTILELAGLPPWPEITGRSLLD